MARGRRPVPFRTRKLRPCTAMVLHPTECGRVARRRNTRNTKPGRAHSPGLRVIYETTMTNGDHAAHPSRTPTRPRAGRHETGPFRTPTNDQRSRQDPRGHARAIRRHTRHPARAGPADPDANPSRKPTRPHTGHGRDQPQTNESTGSTIQTKPLRSVVFSMFLASWHISKKSLSYHC